MKMVVSDLLVLVPKMIASINTSKKILTFCKFRIPISYNKQIFLKSVLILLLSSKFKFNFLRTLLALNVLRLVSSNGKDHHTTTFRNIVTIAKRDEDMKVSHTLKAPMMYLTMWESGLISPQRKSKNMLLKRDLL